MVFKARTKCLGGGCQKTDLLTTEPQFLLFDGPTRHPLLPTIQGHLAPNIYFLLLLASINDRIYIRVSWKPGASPPDAKSVPRAPVSRHRGLLPIGIGLWRPVRETRLDSCFAWAAVLTAPLLYIIRLQQYWLLLKRLAVKLLFC